jgi:anaerobic magnesium-protoporphyrin IX monomethyl ester cyclase
MQEIDKNTITTNNIDVLFVNPPSPDGYVYIRDINRSGRRSRERTIWPQTSLAYLAAVVNQVGYSVDIVDCIALNMGWADLGSILKERNPRFIVINPITSIISNDLYVSYLGKFGGSYTIAAGPHITHLPKETLSRFPSLDFGIIGEAEVTIKELITALDEGKSLKDVKGIVYRDSMGQPKVTAKRPFIEDLDELPIPLHELLPISRYDLPYIGSSYTFVLASRGCPFLCTFCRQPIMWERRVRKRSADSIVTELKYLDALGIHNIMFHADTFTIDRNIVIELCNKIIDQRLPVRWICNSRVDTIDYEMLCMMKQAGCWMINYGIETASDVILENVRKGGNATVDQARKAVEWTKRSGIKVWAYFVMGLPGETKDTVNETIRFAKSLPADIVNFAIGTPYPGTELYIQAKDNNWLVSEFWEDFDQNYSAILSYPDCSSEDVLRSIRRAYVKWYIRPRGIMSFLKGIHTWKDFKTILRIGYDHLKMPKE